jgi:hypothetical protein
LGPSMHGWEGPVCLQEFGAVQARKALTTRPNTPEPGAVRGRMFRDRPCTGGRGRYVLQEFRAVRARKGLTARPPDTRPRGSKGWEVLGPSMHGWAGAVQARKGREIGPWSWVFAGR